MFNIKAPIFLWLCIRSGRSTAWVFLPDLVICRFGFLDYSKGGAVLKIWKIGGISDSIGFHDADHSETDIDAEILFRRPEPPLTSLRQRGHPVRSPDQRFLSRDSRWVAGAAQSALFLNPFGNSHPCIASSKRKRGIPIR
jgi:hypothetical protein